MSSATYNEELTISYTREAFMHPANLAFLLASSLTAFFLNDVSEEANRKARLAGCMNASRV
jgi:hypothetical protein